MPKELHVLVHAGPHPRRLCPVFADLKLTADQAVFLFQEPGHRPRACQLEATPQGSRLWWILSRLDAGQVMEYRLVPVSRRKPLRRWRWEKIDDENWQLTLDGDPVGLLGAKSKGPLPGVGPLFLPGSRSATAVDSVWSTVSLAGNDHQENEAIESAPGAAGAVFSRFRQRAFWLGSKRQRLVEVITTWTWYAMPAAWRLCDVEVLLRASAGPVRFALSGHGGILSAQLAAALWRAPRLTVTNSAGAAGVAEVRAKTAPWLWLWSGRNENPSDSSFAGGIAVFDHAQNPGHPCSWQVSDEGLVASNPFVGLAGFEALFPESPVLATGEALTFRYRLCFHAGAAHRAAIQHRYLDFAFPPRVEVVERP